MPIKTKTFTQNQINRLPEEGYWLEYYKSGGRPTAVCIMNGKVKYIHYGWGTEWHILMWTCCFTKQQIANPDEEVLRYEHFKTHEEMMAAHPELDAAYQTKAPNDYVITEENNKNMPKKFKIGKVSFGCLEDKQVWILKGVAESLNYIGREAKLSKTEEELRKLSIKQINQVIKSIEDSKQID